MKLLSDLTTEQLKGAVGRAIRVQDDKHFFHGAEGVVAAVKTNPSFKVNHVVVGHLIPDGESISSVVMRMPVVNGQTGRIEDKHIDLGLTQAGLVEPPAKPSRPVPKGQVIDVPYTVLKH